MKKFALLLSFLLAAGVAGADDVAKKADAAKPAEKAAAVAKETTHEVAAEVVTVDATAKTITIKGEKDNKTVPVDEKALASVKNLKAGQKVTLICRDSAKGEHQAVAGVKAEAVGKPLAPSDK